MIDVTCALMFAIPLLILLVGVLMLPGYLNKQNTKVFALLKENQNLTLAKLEKDRVKEKDKTRLSITLQAYERMILFMERINPPNLLTRVMIPRQNAGQMQALLLNNIREEYEHNMSQQLYVSDTSWEAVKAVKEDVERLINTSAAKAKQDDKSSVLIQIILTTGFSGKTHPVDTALFILKREMLKNFD